MVARPKINTIKPDMSTLSLFLVSEPKWGKEQPLSEPILTPNGWTTMGELKLRDKVMSNDGKAYNVLAIIPHGVKSIYKLLFSDGSWCRCGAEHLWTMIDNRTGIEQTFDTETIMQQGYKYFDDVSLTYEPKWHLPDVASMTLDTGEFVPACVGETRNLIHIEYDGEEEAQCIQIDAPSHLYITRDFIPTHNTTLFRDTVIHKFGDPEYGLLIKCGAENGDKMLEQVNSVRAENWRDLEDIRDWLLTGKWNIRHEGKKEMIDGKIVKPGQIIGTEDLPHNIKMIAFDTVDELIPLAEKQCIAIHNADPDTKKKTKTINGAMGGYGAGLDYVQKTLLNSLFKPLMDKFGVWVIGHTKLKEQSEQLTDDKYERLVSTLIARYDSYIEGICDARLTGAIEHATASNGLEKDRRYLYLRGNAKVEAGSRLTEIPEKMEFNKPDMGGDFIEMLEEAMRKTSEKQKAYFAAIKAGKNPDNRILNEPIPEAVAPDPIEEPEEEVEAVDDLPIEDEIFDDEVIEEEVEEEISVEEMKKFIAKACSDPNKKQPILKMVKERGGKLSELSVEAMKEVYKFAKK